MNNHQNKGLDYTEVYEKCWESPTFMKELTEAPAKALKEHFNFELELPEGVEMKVVDLSDPSKSYLPLPAEPNWEEMELTDEQLEIVAGGEVGLSGTAIATYIIGAAAVAGICYLWGRYG